MICHGCCVSGAVTDTETDVDKKPVQAGSGFGITAALVAGRPAHAA